MKSCLACFLLLLFAMPAIAQDQDVPREEVLIAPSYSRLGSANLWGWHTALNANWNWWAGLNIDLSGHYFSRDVLYFGQPAATNSQAYSVRAGPQFTFIRNKCCTAFIHGLLGGTWFLSASQPGLETTAFHNAGFSAAMGPGLDININENLAWRVLQADYSFSRILGEPSHGFRMSTGLVLKFD